GLAGAERVGGSGEWESPCPRQGVDEGSTVWRPARHWIAQPWRMNRTQMNQRTLAPVWPRYRLDTIRRVRPCCLPLGVASHSEDTRKQSYRVRIEAANRLDHSGGNRLSAAADLR